MPTIICNHWTILSMFVTSIVIYSVLVLLKMNYWPNKYSVPAFIVDLFPIWLRSLLVGTWDHYFGLFFLENSVREAVGTRTRVLLFKKNKMWGRGDSWEQRLEAGLTEVLGRDRVVHSRKRFLVFTKVTTPFSHVVRLWRWRPEGGWGDLVKFCWQQWGKPWIGVSFPALPPSSENLRYRHSEPLCVSFLHMNGGGGV